MEVGEGRRQAPVPGVLFLDRHAGEEEESLLYAYPRAARGTMDQLKGLLLALRGIMDAIAGQEVAQVDLHQLHPGKGSNVRAAFSPLQDNVVIAMLFPASFSEFVVEQLTAHITSMLHFVHGHPDASWNSKLSEENNEMEQNLDRLFDACFAQAFGGTRNSQLTLRIGPWLNGRKPYCVDVDAEEWRATHLFAALPQGVPYLPLPAEARTALSEALSRVETATGSVAERLLATRRFLDRKAACLFHRGLLVCTHLDAYEQRLVFTFCGLHRLYERTDDHPLVALRQDVYVPASGAAGQAAALTSLDGAPAPSQRRALLVVGLGADLLCLLLTPEGAARAEDLHKSVEFDAVLAALYELREPDNLVRQTVEAQVAALFAAGDLGQDETSRISRWGFSSKKPSGVDETHSLIHQLVYNHTSGLVISKYPLSHSATSTSPETQQTETALREDFMDTVACVRSTLLGMQRCIPTDNGAEASISLQSGTTSLAASIIAQVTAGSVKKLGSGTPSMFTSHAEYSGLRGVLEMTLALRSVHSADEQYYVTGRIDPRGREAYVCHSCADSVSALEASFQLAFGMMA